MGLAGPLRAPRAARELGETFINKLGLLSERRFSAHVGHTKTCLYMSTTILGQ